jgi:hypothetical protein
MLQNIIIILVIMIGCGLVLSPFYFIGKAKRNKDQKANNLIPKEIPLWKGILQASGILIFILLTLIYWAVKNEVDLPSYIDWIAIVSFLVIAGWWSKNSKNKIKK